jgi:GT2 family glycosyltransferase
MSNNVPYLSIIIPVFNQWRLTEQCLKSLCEHTPGSFFEVIVVDNASTDETAMFCRQLGDSLFADRFILLRQSENLGFARACNLGAEQTKGEYLFFLNNDTLLTKDWLPPLFQAFRTFHGLGMVGPLLLYPGTERVQHLGVTFLPGPQVAHLYEHFPADHPVVRRPRRLQAITGAAFLVPRRLFEQCGGFFPGYLNSYEDLDLCTQIRKNNHSLLCIPESKIYHLAGQSEGRFTHDTENSGIFYQRCAACVTPDTHHLVQEDGYELHLTPWLTPYIALPSHRRAQLTLELSRQQNPQSYWAALQQEPLWVDGYALLARALEKISAWEDACLTRILQIHFEPSIQALRLLLGTAKQAGNASLVEQTTRRIQGIYEYLGNPSRLQLKAEIVIAQARACGDEKLEAIYRQWQRETSLSRRHPKNHPNSCQPQSTSASI